MPQDCLSQCVSMQFQLKWKQPFSDTWKLYLPIRVVCLGLLTSAISGGLKVETTQQLPPSLPEHFGTSSVRVRAGNTPMKSRHQGWLTTRSLSNCCLKPPACGTLTHGRNRRRSHAAAYPR